MKLSQDEVKHIALLARMGISDEETTRFSAQLSVILDNFEILEEVDTSQISPTAHVIEVGNILREDESASSLPQNEILANAPHQKDGFFRVKAVLE